MTDKPEWVSTNGDTNAEHAEAREAAHRHNERKGKLLAVVHVHVYENEVQPEVSFPDEAALRPDADLVQIGEVVKRAKESLAGWR